MAKPKPDQSDNHSSGPALILLIILMVLVAIGSVILYVRIWSREQNTSRPVTAVKTKEINTNTISVEDVTVTNPAPNSQVTSPITVTGSAPGTWFFEASFPVRLEDLEGNMLVQSYAQAVGEWMTEEQVEFTSTVDYSVSVETKAVLIFQPDDPAGLGVTEEYRHPVLLLP